MGVLKDFTFQGIKRFGKQRKLNPRYIGSYYILERIDAIAYQLELPQELPNVHNVFYVSMLWRYLSDPSHLLESEQVEIWEDLAYVEHLVRILDKKEQVLRHKVIPLVLVI